MEDVKEMFKALFEPIFDMAINNAKDKEVKNEDVDKRKLIDEVAGIMKSAGCNDELIRTAIAKMEKIGYDKSEVGKADNKEDEVKAEKKVEEVKEELKDDVENKCKNSKDFFGEMNKVYNNAQAYTEQQVEYISRAERLKAGSEMFKKGV